MEDKDYRRKLLYVAEGIVGNILFRNTIQSNIFLKTDLPVDVEVLSIRHDFTRLCFVFELRHDSFEPVPHNEIIPELSTKVTQYCLKLTEEQKEMINV